uniref:Uncharacterized protein n=1 Tax=Tanacetum cinerariifolium TaxID=118510 RepID=A0A699KZB0_TANCI|nr:hypothetical protein [Tanacetum cinerariifolium]
MWRLLLRLSSRHHHLQITYRALNYVPEPEYSEYLVPFDAEEPIEDQPLPDDASPLALSSGYVADSKSKEDPEEDPEEDHADYPTDRGDNAINESSNDDDDDDDDDIEAFKTAESAPTHVPSPRRRMARMSIRAQTPMSATIEVLIVEDDLHEADKPFRKRARFTAPTGRFEVGERSSAAAARQDRHTLAHTVNYGFIDTMDSSIYASESRATTAVGVVNERVIDLAATQRQDAHELYVHCEDALDE